MPADGNPADAAYAHARLAAIVESSDDAIISKTLDGTIQSWNRGAERLFGYSPEEAIGRSITLIIPPDRLDEEREILARITRGDRVDHFETIRQTKSGELVDISVTISPVRDENGQIVGASKVARDIRERRLNERARREADTRKDEFIAVLAHELRIPLAPLRSGLQVMRLAPQDTMAVGQARAMMERQLSNMVRLVDDLLDVARINQNKMDLRRASILLSDVLSNAVETARPAIENAGHSLSLTMPADPVFLDGDQARLAQVFTNLLTNAAKFTPNGGRILLTAKLRGNEAVVSVRDNGVGIPPEALPNVFNMFEQVALRSERQSGGLGIGLALVQGLVAIHGGTVTATSEGVGKGAEFTVRLPASIKAPPLVAPPARVEETTYPASRRSRVLVADDNRDSASSLAMLLRLLGHEVSVANDGLEAVRFAEELRPHAILMDLGMPGLNGYAASQRIREQPWGRDMIIIALTGWGQESDRALSRAAGCDAHLVKPVNGRDVQRLLAELRPRAVAD